MNQTVILVDDRDKFLGYAPKEDCHAGNGKKHRAFVALLFDSQNRVLIQRRKHKLFDNLWDFTAVSHTLHLGDKDEDYQLASDRTLFKEVGVGGAPIKKIGGFNYFAKDGKNCENEYCAILVGRYDGEYQPNYNEVYGIKKVDFYQFIRHVLDNPQEFTPWAVPAVRELKKLNISKFLDF